VPGASVGGRVERGARKLFLRPGPAPPPAGAPPAPAGAAPAPGKPAEPPELPGPLVFRLLDKDNKVLATADVSVLHPKDYVLKPVIAYYPTPDPKAGIEAPRTLQVKLQTEPTFSGPPCRVDLVLRPDRIPELVPGQKKSGSHGGRLKRGGELGLQAQKLQFRGRSEAAPGPVSLTVDGYERAFTYFATFGTGGKSEPQLIDEATLRLDHAPFGRPGTPLPVRIEIDNTLRRDKAVCEVGMFRLPTGQDADETLKVVGERKVRFVFQPAGPGGGLVLEPRVSDHTVAFDTKEIYGTRYLGLRLLYEDKVEEATVQKVIDSKRFEETFKDRATQIIEPVVLDDTQPNVRLLVNLKALKDRRLQLLRGRPLPLKAAASDEESMISKVVFYVGKPLEGEIPPNAAQVEGEQINGTTKDGE